MSPTMTVQELAEVASDWFEGATRPDGSPFRRLKEGAPEWVTAVVRAAHGDFLPDDWRYDKIEDVLRYIGTEASDPEDAAAFAWGQYMEAAEIHGLVLSALEEIAADADDAE